MSILIIGSVALDTIKTPFGEARETPGGSATYACLAAAIFSSVKLLSTAGEDFPSRYIRKLQEKNIDTSGLEICPGCTFRWTGQYGENINEALTLSVCPERLKKETLKIPGHYRNPDYLFLANTDPEVQGEALKRIKPLKLTVLDTMNLWINNKLKSLKGIMRKADILFINETESKMLSGEINLISAAKKIMQDGPGIVVIKKGEHGAFLLSRDDFFAVPAYPLEKVKDPTGAGDSFAGGFLGYLATRRKITPANLRLATVMGAVTASFTVEDFGTRRLEKINRQDLEKRFCRMKQMLDF